MTINARLASFALLLFAAACAGGSSGTTPGPNQTITVGRGTGPTCPPPSPVPTPLPPVLLYPMPGASAVPDNLSLLIFAGSYDGTYGPGRYTLTASSGTPVPLGSPTTAPSPIPSPAVTLPPNYNSLPEPYEALPIAATLAPATTYTFGYVETGYLGSNAPVCTTVTTHAVGSFTTQ